MFSINPVSGEESNSVNHKTDMVGVNIGLYAETQSVKGLKDLIGEEISVEVGTVFRKAGCEDEEKFNEPPANKLTYKSKLVDLDKHGIFLEKKDTDKNLKLKNTRILHVDESYVKIPIPETKTYLPFRDEEYVYEGETRNITYTGILSIKHKNSLVFKRESLY